MKNWIQFVDNCVCKASTGENHKLFLFHPIRKEVLP